MCGKLPWKQKMSMLDASWCIEWLTVYDLTELVLCCLLTVGNATSGGGNVKKRKVRQAASISGHILSTKEHKKKKNFALSLTVARKPNERSLTKWTWVNTVKRKPRASKQCIESNKNGENRKPMKTVPAGVQVNWQYRLLSLLFCPQSCLHVRFIAREFKTQTKHGKVPQLNWPFHGKAHKERKSLSCFWLGLDARQKSDEISS